MPSRVDPPGKNGVCHTMSMKIPLIMHKLGIVSLPATFNFAVTMVAMHSKLSKHSGLYHP